MGQAPNDTNRSRFRLPSCDGAYETFIRTPDGPEQLRCPLRGADMHLISFISDARTARDILAHLGEPTAPPRIAPDQPADTQFTPRCCPESNESPRIGKHSLCYVLNMDIIVTMVSLTSVENELGKLGARLREARLARDDSMQVFAQRIGVSVPTLRAMEQGSSSVQIGYWANALWALDRLHDLAAVLPQSTSPLDRARERPTAKRQRATRRSA